MIIGTGHAGPSLAARFAAGGMAVAIIERHKFGGACVIRDAYQQRRNRRMNMHCALLTTCDVSGLRVHRALLRGNFSSGRVQ